ncbi:MAG: serine/threonine-protein kinase [Acidobacteriota bacterium]
MRSTSNADTRLDPTSRPRSHALDFAPGTILTNRYRIVARLGRGGMGEVYRADDLRLGQSVALKFLPDVLADDPVAREMLLTEARHARDVSHPNVCRVYDIEELDAASSAPQAGQPADAPPPAVANRRLLFLTMEYIDGEDLASLLRRIGKLPPAKAIEVGRQLCAGLAAAHDRGVLHRDLKPGNVMIDGMGRARITDFGLAVKHTDSGAPADFAGTPAYMSPERLRGAPATVQSDLYALGLVLYEIFTGTQPFAAQTPDDWRRVHAGSAPRRPSLVTRDVEPAVERVILQCLEKDPARRPRSASQAGAMLPGGDPLAAAVAAGETPSPEMVAAAGSEGTLSRRKAWGALAAAILSLAGVIALYGWVEMPALLRFKGSPDVLRSHARDILAELGYRDDPADSAWWFSVEPDYQRYLVGLEPAARRFAGLADERPGPLAFHYRQSSQHLAPLSHDGVVSATDPAPVQPGDALVSTDTFGNLTALRIVPARRDAETIQSPSLTWTALLTAAGLEAASLREAPPSVVPPVFADARAAWTGTYRAQAIRVEAAAWRGRPVFFAMTGPWTSNAPAPAVEATLVVQQIITVLWMLVLLTLSWLAVRNVKLGRSDRRGALRVAVFILCVAAVRKVLAWHWAASAVGLWMVVQTQFGAPLFWALAVWVCYIGFEPFVRRRWPNALIAWARMLDGRLRDPLVGRSVLAGVIGGAAVAGVVALPELLGRLLGLPGVSPWIAHRSLNAANLFVGDLLVVFGDGVIKSFGLMAVVLVVRLVLRSDRAALVAAYLVSVLSSVSDSQNVGLALAAAVPAGAIVVVLLRRFGIVAVCVMVVTYDVLAQAPLTLDPNQWFAWRSLAAFAMLSALAVWGFRNVLGRQSAFPIGASHGVLDD